MPSPNRNLESFAAFGLDFSFFFYFLTAATEELLAMKEGAAARWAPERCGCRACRFLPPNSSSSISPAPIRAFSLLPNPFFPISPFCPCNTWCWRSARSSPLPFPSVLLQVLQPSLDPSSKPPLFLVFFLLHASGR